MSNPNYLSLMSACGALMKLAREEKATGNVDTATSFYHRAARTAEKLELTGEFLLKVIEMELAECQADSN